VTEVGKRVRHSDVGTVGRGAIGIVKPHQGAVLPEVTWTGAPVEASSSVTEGLSWLATPTLVPSEGMAEGPSNPKLLPEVTWTRATVEAGGGDPVQQALASDSASLTQTGIALGRRIRLGQTRPVI
jgi:hypothetical protein